MSAPYNSNNQKTHKNKELNPEPQQIWNHRDKGIINRGNILPKIPALAAEKVFEVPEKAVK
jgi:hypothetical protein